MFTAALMAGIAYVASSIPRLIAAEVVERPISALRQRPTVAVMWIKPVVDMSVKPTRSVEPGTRSEKHTSHKPIGTVVAVRSAVIRLVVEVSVGTDGRRPNIDADGNLGWRVRRRHKGTTQHDGGNSCESNSFGFEHGFSLVGSFDRIGAELRFVSELEMERRVLSTADNGTPVSRLPA
jgi:hypothetical protein